MKRVSLIIIVVLGLIFSAKGQDVNYIGGGMSVGYKSTYHLMGIFAQSRLFNHLDIEGGFSMSYFMGPGYSGGISYVPLKTKLQPFVGLQYSKNYGGQIDITPEGSNTTFFKINPVDYYYAKTGLMIKLRNLDGYTEENRIGFFTLSLSYRFKLNGDYQVHYVKGDIFEDEELLNSAFDEGLGFSFSVIILFGKSKKKKN